MKIPKVTIKKSFLFSFLLLLMLLTNGAKVEALANCTFSGNVGYWGACHANNINVNITSGHTTSVSNVTSGYTGYVTYLCTNGGWSVDSSDCTQLVANTNCAGTWSGYSACSASCDGGTQSKTFTVTTAQSGTGAACPASPSSQTCNTQACYVAPVCSPIAGTTTCNQDLTVYGVPANYTVGTASYTYNSCTYAVTYTGGCSAPAPAPSALTVAITAFDPSTVTVGQMSRISFNISSYGADWQSTRCSAGGTAAVNWGPYLGQLNVSGIDGAYIIPNTAGTYTQSITCTDSAGSATSPTQTLTVNPLANTTATLTASPTSVAYNAASTLTWSSTNATSCTGAGGSFNGAKATSGSVSTGNLTAGQVYTLYCTGAGGNSSTQSVTVTAAASFVVPTVNAGPDQTITLPTSSITATGSAIDPDGIIVSHTWSQAFGPSVTITNPSAYNTTITGFTKAGSYAFTINAVMKSPGADTATSFSLTVNPASATHTLSFNTNGGIPTTIASITGPEGMAISWPANPTKTGYTYIGWTPLGPQSLPTMPAQDVSVITAWSAISYGITYTATNGSVTPTSCYYGTTVTPVCTPNDGNYTVSCPAAFTCSTSNSKTATFAASSANGTCGTANGRTYPNGSSSYSPYVQCGSGSASNPSFPGAGSSVSWICSGTSGGSASGTCSASQDSPVPSAFLTVSPNPVAYGGRSTLTWSSTGATSCTAGGPWSNSGTLSGSGLTDSITTATSFTFQCFGPGGTSPLKTATVTTTSSSCPNGQAYVGSSCVACTGGCTGSGGTVSNPYGSLSCNNGALNPVSCDSFPTCTTPWGSTISNGVSVPAFKYATVISPSVCTGTGLSESRLCSGGSLSGSYTNVNCSVLIPTVDLFSVTPTRVPPGGTVTVRWGTTNVTGCSVTKNGVSTPWSGTNTSKTDTVNTKTTYAITCDSLAPQSVTVNVAPGFNEF